MRAACANTMCPDSNDLSNANFDCVINGSAGGVHCSNPFRFD
jgi:hypothetical protein